MAKKKNNEEMISFKANVTLPKEEYEKYKRGEIHSDKGLRGDDGRLRALPDIEEIEDGDKNECQYPSYDESEIQEYQERELTPEQRELYDAIETILALVAIKVCEYAYYAAKPHVVNWWNTKLVPGVKNLAASLKKKDIKATKRLKKTKSDKAATHKRVTTTDIAVQNMNALNTLSGNIEIMYDEYIRNITSEEAQQHLINIVVLTACLAHEIKELSGVVIRDNEKLSTQYQSDIEQITQQKVMQGLNNILTQNINLLDAETEEKFTTLMGCPIITGGKFQPIDRMQIKELLEIKT